jgi:Zn-finger nucleic acid-binding protein
MSIVTSPGLSSTVGEPTMKCVACGNDLQKITVKDITGDACKGGCSGMLFDQFELKFEKKGVYFEIFSTD